MIYDLLLGSNLDEPARQVDLALAKLKALPASKVIAASVKLKNKAYGYEDQPDFINQVVRLKSELEPNTLLKHLQKIEAEMGRQRSFKWAPRNIDIDILLAEDLVLDTPDLVIPHYDLVNRDFALKLLCAVAPEAKHPTENKSICQLLSELERIRR